MKPLEAIIKAGHGENLRKVLETVKDKISDIRQGDYTNETRLCAIAFLEKEIGEKISIYSRTTGKSEDNWK